VIDQPLSDRAKLMLVWPVAGFFVVVAFGVGLISMATFETNAATVAASGVTAAGSPQTIQVELGDLFIKPEQLQAEAGPLRFEVTNNGNTEHNFALQGLG
jgi:uncharacterized cupredoxin-like copper-binding protein